MLGLNIAFKLDSVYVGHISIDDWSINNDKLLWPLLFAYKNKNQNKQKQKQTNGQKQIYS